MTTEEVQNIWRLKQKSWICGNSEPGWEPHDWKTNVFFLRCRFKKKNIKHYQAMDKE